MNSVNITEKDRDKAQKCMDCPICKRARRNQKGLAFWFVKRIESRFCPNGKAYARVYGRKPHEPIPV